VNSFTAHANLISRIKQSPFNTSSNNLVATCSDDNTVKIWNISTPSNWILIRTYTGHTYQVNDLEWLNEGTIVSGSYEGTVKIWSICTGETQTTFNPGSNVYSLNLLSNGFYLASGLADGRINIHNINDLTITSLIVTLNGHTGYVFDLVLINSDLLASSSWDYTVKIWNLTTYSIKFILTGHASAVYGLKLLSTQLLASGSSDSTIKIWNISSGTLINTLSFHAGYIMFSISTLYLEMCPIDRPHNL